MWRLFSFFFSGEGYFGTFFGHGEALWRWVLGLIDIQRGGVGFGYHGLAETLCGQPGNTSENGLKTCKTEKNRGYCCRHALAAAFAGGKGPGTALNLQFPKLLYLSYMKLKCKIKQ